MAWSLIKNYIYIKPLDSYYIIPSFPDSLSDTIGSTFSSQNALSRTAPTLAYSYSGPRQVQIMIQLHRDMFDDVNATNTSVGDIKIDNDYVDSLIKALTSVALPKYDSTNYGIIPPSVAVRFGDDLFIEGVVQGGVTVTFEKPLLDNNKYALVNISFQVVEVQPYDALAIAEVGSFRHISSAMRSKMGG